MVRIKENAKLIFKFLIVPKHNCLSNNFNTAFSAFVIYEKATMKKTPETWASGLKEEYHRRAQTLKGQQAHYTWVDLRVQHRKSSVTSPRKPNYQTHSERDNKSCLQKCCSFYLNFTYALCKAERQIISLQST